MQTVFNVYNSEKVKSWDKEWITWQFINPQVCKGCIKSSFLTIELVNYYVENTTNDLGLFVAINGCFFASVILGLSLLKTIMQLQPDTRNVNVLFDSLHIPEIFYIIMDPLMELLKDGVKMWIIC